MLNRTLFTTLLALVAFAVPASGAAAAGHSGAVVFSKVTIKDGGEGKAGIEEGGLFAVRDGRLNQLTTDPSDSQPAFSPDGTSIAFVRDGDIYSVRADGSGQRQLTNGAELDTAPVVAPNGKFVVFERRAGKGAPADLYTVGTFGGGLRALTGTAEDDHDASFSADGRSLVFVRSTAETGAGTADDLYSIRANGGRPVRLTRTARFDEFEPRYFAGGILYSRGESTEGPSAYADIYRMRSNGIKVHTLVAGAGSAYVEDVTPNGKTVLFRRDRGLWVKPTGRGRARKLTELPDGSTTNAVFSSDGLKVAAFVAAEGRESLSSIDVASGRRTDLAEGLDFSGGESGTTIGPVISWQPVRR
jgi:Tol biopolymer transport system component